MLRTIVTPILTIITLMMALPAFAYSPAGGGGKSGGGSTVLTLGLGQANDGDGVTHAALLAFGSRGGWILRSGYWGESIADSRIKVTTNILATGWESPMFNPYPFLSINGQLYASRACDQTVVKLPGDSNSHTEKSVSGGIGFGSDARLRMGPAVLRLGWESHFFFGSPEMLVLWASIKKTVLFVEIGGAL